MGISTDRIDGLQWVLSVKWIGIWASTAVLIAGIVSSPVGGLEREMQLVLAVFGFTLILWLTESVPYTVSSTAAIVLLYALDLVDTFGEAAGGFASELVFFLFLLLLLGGAISKVGLAEIAAGRMLSTRSTPRSTVKSLGAHLMALSLLMPSAVARAVTFIPIVNEMTDAYGLDRDGPFRNASFLVLGHVNPIGSMMLMTGGGMAIITSQLINDSVRTVTWVEWAIYMIPPMVLLFWASTLATLVLYPIDGERTVDSEDLSDGMAAAITEDREPLTRNQTVVGLVMLGAVVAWIIGSFIGVPTIVPAVAAVAVLALPGVAVVDRELVADVSWGILFLIGAMFSILEVMEETGTLELVVDSLITLIPFDAMSTLFVVGTLLGLAVFIRVWFSTASAAIVVTLPIIMEFGAVLGVNQVYLALSVLIVVGSTTFFPFNTTSVLLSFDKGPLELREVFGFGAVMMLLGAVTVVLSWHLYWPLVV
ncbi:SLC13 family permease [Halorubrum vacuolatum]|uniref:Anion transporter n=1 Tax=Halorubrum vacuolatum TaxID=63740 RepID=A0A238WIF3_HALVU|nr:SLC13 family permease [Halorubrum vacuolatum]SNR46257.1 anion transporter [Halorubrum vacuolatum]